MLVQHGTSHSKELLSTIVVVNSQLFSTMVVVNSQHGGTTSADRRPTSSLPTMALPRSPAPVWKGRTVALLVQSAVQLHVPSDRARPRASRAERVPECRADATTTSPSVRRLQRRPSAKNCHVVLVLSVGAQGGPRYAISTLRPSARSLAELGNLPGVMELTAPVLLVLLKPREAWEQLGGRLGVDCLDVAAVEDPFVMGDDVLSEEMAATSFTLTSETSFEHGQQQGLPFRSYDWSPVGSITIVYSCSINAAKELICGTIQVRWLFGVVRFLHLLASLSHCVSTQAQIASMRGGGFVPRDPSAFRPEGASFVVVAFATAAILNLFKKLTRRNVPLHQTPPRQKPKASSGRRNFSLSRMGRENVLGPSRLSRA